jgi:hypothetical protein
MEETKEAKPQAMHPVVKEPPATRIFARVVEKFHPPVASGIETEMKEMKEIDLRMGQRENLRSTIDNNEKLRMCWLTLGNWPEMTDQLRPFADLALQYPTWEIEWSSPEQIRGMIAECEKRSEDLSKRFNQLEKQYVDYAQYVLDRYKALSLLGTLSPLKLIAGSETSAETLQKHIQTVQKGGHLSAEELKGLFLAYGVIAQATEEMANSYADQDLPAKEAYNTLVRLQSIQQNNNVLLAYFPSFDKPEQSYVEELKELYKKFRKALVDDVIPGKLPVDIGTLQGAFEIVNDRHVRLLLPKERWEKWHADLDIRPGTDYESFLTMNAQGRTQYLQRILNTRSSHLRRR